MRLQYLYSYCLFVIYLILWVGDEPAAQNAVKDCATCHPSIADEWRDSLHADSYTSPVFLADKRIRWSEEESCGCHGPERLAPAYLGKTPPARTHSLESGVDCLACHFDSDMVAWSSGETKYVPHWTREAEIYSTGKFCSGCHTWARELDADCSGCHMPPVSGPAADGPHLEEAPEATHRSHRWAGSRDAETVRSAVVMASVESSEQLAVEVTNLVQDHKFPASDHRYAVIVVIGKNADEVLSEDAVKVPPGSTSRILLSATDLGKAASIELRFYPSRATWPERYYVIEHLELP
jgi:hypothetical protein